MSTLSVVIGRFQTPHLTPAHVSLLDNAARESERVLVLIGTIPSVTKHDPLTFIQRANMLYELPIIRHKFICVPLPGHPSNHAWAQQVDTIIRAVADGRTVRMFWGPDSAHKIYKAEGGRYSDDAHTHTIEHHPIIHATEVRGQVQEEFGESFRRGAIWQQNRQLAKVYPTVDIGITRGIGDRRMILLGRKENDQPGLWRFPGGFVDPTDTSLEHAAKREAREETGGNLELDSIEYVGSFLINDWRYRHGPEKIMTTLVSAHVSWGSAKAGDDLAEVSWFPLNDVRIDPVHEPLLFALRDFHWKAGR